MKYAGQGHTDGSPRLSPIPPNAETSSNRTRKRSNHFIDSSTSLARSMIATMNTAHASHHMSGNPLVLARYILCGWAIFACLSIFDGANAS